MTTNPIVQLYLSRLLVDSRSRQVLSELAQPYEMHRTLMHAFERHPLREQENAREKFSVLFRSDADDRSNRVIVYVQSNVEPDWSFLDHIPGYLLPRGRGEPNPAYKNVATAFQELRDEQVLSFRLRANPTKRLGKNAAHGGAMKGKRVGLLREEEQIDWLIRKGQEREKGSPGGFKIITTEVDEPNGGMRRVPRIHVRCEGRSKGRKRKNGSPQEIAHLSVCFEGLLQITNADAFRETLSRGIGSAKAFGFGLLSIALPSRQ